MKQESEQMQTSNPAASGSNLENSAKELPKPTPIEFTGKATEYFNIWLNNLFLSTLTLGIYSAWAKVRRTRYFLGNTIILGDGVEYHATGMMILKGRLIAVAVIVGLAAIGLASPVAQAIVALGLIPIYPWVINRALKFRARMTSWRNVRFDWHGEYWGVAKVYLLWPVIGVLTLGALAPMAARASREYLANHYALGREQFGATTPLRPYYWTFLQAIIFGVALSAIVAGFVVVVLVMAEQFTSSGGLGVGGVSVWEILIFIFIILIPSVGIYYRILTRNIIVSALTLGDAAKFHSNLSPLRYQWILLSNYFVTVFTATLMYPWAQIRAYRYQVEHVTVRPSVAIATFLDAQTSAGHAFGEEIGEMEDIGIEI